MPHLIEYITFLKGLLPFLRYALHSNVAFHPRIKKCFTANSELSLALPLEARKYHYPIRDRVAEGARLSSLLCRKSRPEPDESPERSLATGPCS